MKVCGFSSVGVLSPSICLIPLFSFLFSFFTVPDPDAVSGPPDVDDADGLDEQAEYEAWKLRELTRVKRDREERVA